MVAAAGAQYVIPLIPTELIYNTHKSPPNPFCWASRPCYRELGCEYCWQRKRKFLLRQIRYLGVKWGLSNFCTLTATNFDGDQHMALRLMGEVRAKVMAPFFKRKNYIAFLSCHGESSDREAVPHSHFLLNDYLKKPAIKKALLICYPSVAWNIQIKTISEIAWVLSKIGGYLTDQNYRNALRYRPRRLRLVTGSSGFYAGRPRQLPGMDFWEAFRGPH
jgi:hypothetical protein